MWYESGMERWVFILGGVEIIVGGLVTALPTFVPQWVGFPIMAIGILTIAYGVLTANKPQPAYYGTPTPKAWIWNWRVAVIASSIFPLSRLIPLRQAAQMTYDKTRGSTAAIAAEREGGPEEILSWYSHALTGRDGATLYGKKPPSTKFEIVPRENMGQYHFIEQFSAVAYHGKQEPVYENLMIKKTDLKRRARVIKSWSMN